MYWVSGWLSRRDSRICSSLIGCWRQAFGLSDPLRKALAATLVSVSSEMSWSCR